MIFQPTNINPDIKGGLGYGTRDLTQGLTVEWVVNGNSPLLAFSITIYANDANSTLLYTTGQVTDDCPFYPVNYAGEQQAMSYFIDAATLAGATIENGSEYKLIIAQWYGVGGSDYVEQSSASVFVGKADPTLTIDAIPAPLIARSYTFTATYAQAQGDALNWVRWQIASADDQSNPFYDTGNIYGTAQLQVSYDGFFTGNTYSIQCSAQTVSGVDVTTGWVDFDVDYPQTAIEGAASAVCVKGKNAVKVSFSPLSSIVGTGTGTYSFADGQLTLASGAKADWDMVNGEAMHYDAPWSLLYKCNFNNSYANRNLAEVYTDYTWEEHDEYFGDIIKRYRLAARSVGKVTTIYRVSLTLFMDYSTDSGATWNVFASYPINLDSAQDTSNADVTFYLTATHFGMRIYANSTAYTLTQSIRDYYGGAVAQLTAWNTFMSTAMSHITLDGVQKADYFQVFENDGASAYVQGAITDGTYTPIYDTNTIFLASFDNADLSAGNIATVANIEDIAIYRKGANETTLTHVANAQLGGTYVYDYGAQSQQGDYTYYVVPRATEISTKSTSGNPIATFEADGLPFTSIKANIVATQEFPASALPAGYTQVEYIESTGTQCINTNHFIASEKMRYTGRFVFTSTSSSMRLFGRENPTWSGILYNTTGILYAGTTGSVLNLGKTWDTNTPYDIDLTLNNGSATLIANGIVKTGTYTGTLINNTYPVYLFAVNANNNITGAISAKLYGFKMYDNDVLVRDFVPCIRESDGAVGLYDKVNNYFRTNIGTGTFTAGTSPWIGDAETTPYLFREAGGGATVGNSELDTVVGGTVAWNQILQNGNFASTSGWALTSSGTGTVAAADNKGTFTSSNAPTANSGIRHDTSIDPVLSHKYLLGVSLTPSASNAARLYYGGTSLGVDNVPIVAGKKTRIETIIEYAVVATNPQRFGIQCNRNETMAEGDTCVYEDAIVCDLTSMFGTTIADYIYSLEQTTAGAGIAWLQNHGYFTEDYYAYDAGSLQSVCAASHVIGGKNLFNIAQRVVAQTNASGTVTTGYTLSGDSVQITKTLNIDGRVFFSAQWLPAGDYVYSFKASATGTYNVAYSVRDMVNKVDIKPVAMSVNATIAVPFKLTQDTFVAVSVQPSETTVGTLTASEIQIQMGATATAYTPYTAPTIYPLDNSLTLRGVPKLDGNNKLYFDGDEYTADGNVARRYGIVDLGTLTWTYNANYYGNPIFTSNRIGAKDTWQVNVGMCLQYEWSPNKVVNSTFYDKTVCTVGDGRVFIRDAAYSDAATFKTAVSGVYLVYPLATKTTETADPFTARQEVTAGGTEEYYDGNVWGCVDLGTLTWANNSTSGGHYRCASGDIASVVKHASAGTDVIGVVNNKYSVVSSLNTYNDVVGISIDVNGYIQVYDTNYNTSTSASDFKAAMSGVYLIYPLATKPRAFSLSVGHSTNYANYCPISGETGTTVTRTGVNLLAPKYAGRTNNGITYTVDGNLITAIGTASPSNSFCASNHSSNPAMMTYLPAGTYMITSNDGITGVRVYLTGIYLDGDAFPSGAPIGNGEYYVLTKDAYAYPNIRINNGTNLSSGHTFKIQVVKGTTVHDFEPYAGDAYTVDWSNAVSEKNKFNVDAITPNASLTITNGTISVTGNSISSGKTLSQLADLTVGETYILTATTTGTGNYIYLSVAANSWYFGTQRAITQDDLDSFVLFYSGGVGVTAKISNMMIRLASISNSAFVPYYAGEVFGGVADAVSGDVDATYQKSVLTYAFASSLPSDYIGVDTSGRAWIRNWLTPAATNTAERRAGGVGSMCNYCKVSVNNTNIFASQYRTYFWTPNNVVDRASFLEWLKAIDQEGSELYVINELETPNKYTLAGQSIDTLEGANYVWDDIGTVDTEYEIYTEQPAPLITNPLCVSWWMWTVLECTQDEDGFYQVLNAYNFRNNLTSGKISNNNSPNVALNFTKYPTVQTVPQNFKSGALQSLIGAVTLNTNTGAMEYADSLALRDSIYNLSTTTNPLFLKNTKGDLLKIKINGAIEMETSDNTRELMQTMELPWVEVGSTKGISIIGY